jgi:hypothetical protein
MTQRTNEEIRTIVARCVEIEKEGGDVLGYLKSEHYVTPRATWYNFQRERLHRKPGEYTEGKPGKGGTKKMSVTMKAERQKRLEDLKARISGGMGIREALADMGYRGKGAGQTYRQIRNFAMAYDPEALGMLPERISGAVKRAEVIEPSLKMDGEPRIEIPEAGMMIEAEVPEKVKPLNVVKRAITEPICYDGMTVREVEQLFGRYRRSDINGEVYIDFENADRADIMSYTVNQWRGFLDELHRAARILGVEL